MVNNQREADILPLKYFTDIAEEFLKHMRRILRKHD